jgi:hypothetical protein
MWRVSARGATTRVGGGAAARRAGASASHVRRRLTAARAARVLRLARSGRRCGGRHSHTRSAARAAPGGRLLSAATVRRARTTAVCVESGRHVGGHSGRPPARPRPRHVRSDKATSCQLSFAPPCRVLPRGVYCMYAHWRTCVRGTCIVAGECRFAAPLSATDRCTVSPRDRGPVLQHGSSGKRGVSLLHERG